MKLKKVILHPGMIRSRHDDDTHFISASNLAHLYGVLPIDHVVIFNGKSHISEEVKYREGWIDLYPRFDGDYEDIHKYDDIEIKDIKI